jgi:DNA-binding transcriptional LysR family regulator
VTVAAVVTATDETCEAVANGVGVALLSAGNAALYARTDVVMRPVRGLGPSELVVLWRDDDHRTVIRDVVLACTTAADTPSPAP